VLHNLTVTVDRYNEIAQNFAVIEQRILAACQKSGRDPGEIHLIGVTKTYPASDIDILIKLGIRDIGENRDQEARQKIAQLAELTPKPRWHFIGQLQRNKARSVARYADVVHGVDRPSLVTALQEAAMTAHRTVDVLLQVDLSDTPVSGRGGVVPEQLEELARLVINADSLVLRGVMGVAPLNGDPYLAFALLQKLSQQLITLKSTASWISAGMSEDLEAAIYCGATHLRIGSGLLGKRAYGGVR
jgi:PLP dependent protein